MLKHSIIGIVVVIIGIIGVWYAGDEGPLIDDELAQQVLTGPDYYMKDFTVKVMDEKGELSYILKAEHMDHFIKSEVTLLNQPNMVFYEPSQKRQWRLDAEKGKIEGKETNRVIRLEGKVHLTHEIENNPSLTHIRTDNMTVWPENKTLRTDDPVTIENPAAVVDAVGMRANFKTNTLSLLSNVQSHYYPVQPK